MKTNDKLLVVKYGLLYFLPSAIGATLLKLWDTWSCLLTGEPVDWAAALGALDFGRIAAIALPVSVALVFSTVRKERNSKAPTP